MFRHARRQTSYVPVAEDWIFHTVLPLIAYAALLASGLLMPRDTDPALFVIGASTLLLLFVGIHNAWDAVTYIATEGRKNGDKPDGGAQK